MMKHPVTFLTGYGWQTHQLMFTLVTHNDYLNQLFELGLVGLLAFLTIFYQSVRTALHAAVSADAQVRPYMIAFVFGMLGLAVSIFFVNLEKPWDYVWLYAGFTLRAASNAIEKAQAPSAPAAHAVAKPAGYAADARARARTARPRLVGDLRR
jgi:O-antigen ligase